MANLFERLSGSQSAPAALEKKDHKDHKRQTEEELLFTGQRLLDFVTQKWAKDTISLRDIYIFGPYALQKEKQAALEAAEFLAARGWLEPLKSHRHDRREWQILRKPIIRPTVVERRL